MRKGQNIFLITIRDPEKKFPPARNPHQMPQMARWWEVSHLDASGYWAVSRFDVLSTSRGDGRFTKIQTSTKISKTPKDTQRHPKNFKDTQRHPKTPKEFQRHPKTSKDTQRHPRISKKSKDIQSNPGET
jgi:hypothetical protein